MSENPTLVRLPVDTPIWDRFFLVHPLVIVGTLEPNGEPDFAPKHMAMPMSWENWFGFVCTPRHATYHNAKREGAFTVSYPSPEKVLLTTLAAMPPCGDHEKASLQALGRTPADVVNGFLVDGCPLHFECETDRVIDGFGDNSLIVGRIVAVHADPAILRSADKDEAELVHEHPLLVYLQHGRFASLERSRAYPFPKGFAR
jgi:flavin reductase (DIM6/NTAB) family NADH-FMN oxidoreductase RutF